MAVAKLAEVANVDYFVPQNRNPAEKIFQGLLRGKCDGDTANARQSFEVIGF